MKGPQRSFHILDLMIGHLKFFERFNEEQRHAIYEKAEYQTFDAQTVIFSQDDAADKMYIILKGRVNVQQRSKEHGNLPVVKYVKNDGEQFGELGLIDQGKVDDHTKPTMFINEDELFDRKPPKQSGRSATLITTEQTDCLVVDGEFSQKLIQNT